MEKNIKKLTKKGITWYDITSPTEENIRFLEKKFGFHELDLEDLELRKIQRSKIDDYEDYLFIVLHLPVYQKSRDRIISAQMDIFVGQDYFVTVRSPALKNIDKIIEKCEDSEAEIDEYMGSGTGYLLYNVISDLFDGCFPLLDELESEINDLERELFLHDFAKKDMLQDILMMKKDLTTFNRVILPQRTVIAQLEHKNKKFMTEDLNVYFDDIVDKVEKIWNNLENYQEMVNNLQNINESMISHNTNRIITTLTVFSVIMLPLTLVSGIYGMNLNDLPAAGQTYSFEFVIGIMLIIAIIMLAYFKYKKWI